MQLFRLPGIVRALTICLSAALNLSAQSQVNVNVDWLPISEAEKKMTAPLVEKDAAVEAIFWEVRVLDEFRGSDLERVLYHYLRLKVFSEKGKEQVSTVDIPFDEKTTILYVTGRTVKADGTIVELKKDAIHERDLIRAGRLTRRVKSFAMPGVEPGAIVEYRWKEVRRDPNIWYSRLQLQRDIPVQKVRYFVRPLPAEYSAGYNMSVWPFNCKPSPLKLDERQEFSVTSLENVPAFKEEPYMPAEAGIRPWLLILYHNRNKREPASYWEDVGKDIYSELKRRIKLTDELKKATQEAVAGVPEDQKVLALIRYIRRTHRSPFDNNVTDAERIKYVKSLPKDRYRHTGEIFESRMGTADELNTVFAAMAIHAGLDARPVRIADRNDVPFSPQLTDRYFLPHIDMAVKQGDTWSIFDVSARNLPPEMLLWNEAGMDVLISDPKKPYFVKSRPARPEDTVIKRTARLALSAEGALSGSMQEQYTGHEAYQRRLQFAGKSEASIAEMVKDAVTGAFPKAEVTDVTLKNLEDPEQPLTLTFTLSAPQYAQRTGRRLFFQPAVFKRGDPPVFSAAERLHDVHFRYGWTEDDEIYIKLPEGYVLDVAENPGDLTFGKPGSYGLQMEMQPGRTLFCKRSLTFGANDILLFPKSVYPALRKGFDEIHRRDNTAVSLKVATPAGL